MVGSTVDFPAGLVPCGRHGCRGVKLWYAIFVPGFDGVGLTLAAGVAGAPPNGIGELLSKSLAPVLPVVVVPFLKA